MICHPKKVQRGILKLKTVDVRGVFVYVCVCMCACIVTRRVGWKWLLVLHCLKIWKQKLGEERVEGNPLSRRNHIQHVSSEARNMFQRAEINTLVLVMKHSMARCMTRGLAMFCQGSYKPYLKSFQLCPAVASSLFDHTGQVSQNSMNTYSIPSKCNWRCLACEQIIPPRISKFLAVYFCWEIPLLWGQQWGLCPLDLEWMTSRGGAALFLQPLVVLQENLRF